MATILRVSAGKELHTWVTYPRRWLYPPESLWVPPLDRDLRRMLDRRRNPFFRHGDAAAFLALDAQGSPVGRVLAHVSHRHNVRHREATAFFGFFECHPETATARALFTAARAFAAAHGCDTLKGPFNMTPMQEMGVVVAGFAHPPAVDQVFNLPYYADLLAAAGLQPCLTATTFHIPPVATDPATLLTDRHREWLASGRLRVRPANRRAFRQEMESLRELINESMYENTAFTALTAAEFDFQAGPLMFVMDPELCLIAELDGVPCAYLLAIPDFNPLLKQMRGTLGLRSLWTFLRGRRQIREAAVVIAGTQRHLQNLGIMRVVVAELLSTLQRRGFRRLSTTWITDDNPRSLASTRAMGGTPAHRVQLFAGPVADPVPGPAQPGVGP